VTAAGRAAWRASLGTLAAFVRKEGRHLLRDRQTLGILLFLPVAQVVLFGYAVRTDIREVRVAVVSPVPDVAVSALRTQLAGSGRYTLLPPVADHGALDDAFRRGDADVGIVLPSGVAERLRAGEPLPVLVVADASDPNTGTTMQGYVAAALAEWQGRLGVAGPAVRVVPSVRMRYNPTLASVHLFVPGLIATILTLVTTLMTAISLSREKERGSWEVLLVSPLHPWQVIIGKVVPYLGLAMANVATVLLAARLVFDVPLRGSLALLLATSVLFALVGLALGVLIAAVTRSQLAAMLAALGGTMLPNIMLSGLVFPLASLPTPLFVASHLIPARWFIEIVRGIMLKGAGIAELWPNVAVLGAMLVVLLAASIRRTDVRLA
jgi:ABC-2 type transport system permease protein